MYTNDLLYNIKFYYLFFIIHIYIIYENYFMYCNIHLFNFLLYTYTFLVVLLLNFKLIMFLNCKQ